jgi:hypothetical protein
MTIAEFCARAQDVLNRNGANAPHIWQVGELADGAPGFCILLEGIPPTRVAEVRLEEVGLLVNNLAGLGSWDEFNRVLGDYDFHMLPMAPTHAHVDLNGKRFSVVAENGELVVCQGWVRDPIT